MTKIQDELSIPDFLKRSKTEAPGAPRLDIPSTPGGVRGAPQVPYKANPVLAKVTKAKKAEKVAHRVSVDELFAGKILPASKPAKPKAEKPKAAPKMPSKPKAKVAAKATTPRGKTTVEFGGKKGKLWSLLTRPGGATMPQLLKACGWKRCRSTLGKMARSAGKKVRVDDQGRYSV
jgi:hypothetical protein